MTNAQSLAAAVLAALLAAPASAGFDTDASALLAQAKTMAEESALPEPGYVVVSAKEKDKVTDQAAGQAFQVKLEYANALCDHMPTFGPRGANQHLILQLSLTNGTTEELEVNIAEAYVSTELGKQGNKLAPDALKLAVLGPKATGKETIKIKAGKTADVGYRGLGVFPEDLHGQTIYVTVVFSAGGETLKVYKAVVVGAAY